MLLNRYNVCHHRNVILYAGTGSSHTIFTKTPMLNTNISAFSCEMANPVHIISTTSLRTFFLQILTVFCLLGYGYVWFLKDPDPNFCLYESGSSFRSEFITVENKQFLLWSTMYFFLQESEFSDFALNC